MRAPRRTPRTAHPSAPAFDAATVRSVELAARRTVGAAAPGLRTEMHWGHRWLVGRDLVCLVGGFSRHVSVEFWRGASLDDPGGLLEGTGKNLRHVKLRSVAEATAPELTRMVRSAVRLDAKSPPRARAPRCPTSG